jgi:hypothetical protein
MQQHCSTVLLFSFQHSFNVLRAEEGKQRMHMHTLLLLLY